MDVIEIVIAEIDLPLGRAPRAEILVNGAVLADLVERAEGLEGGGYAPLVPRVLGRELYRARPGERTRVQLLGCCCGVDGCSKVMATIRGDDEVAVWEDIGNAPEAVGPFRFDRAQYEAALAKPRIADAPARHYGA